MVNAATPDAGNLMPAAFGTTHGLRRTPPRLLGVCLGFGLMVATAGPRLAGPTAASPALHSWLRWTGDAGMPWSAFGIARSAVVEAAPQPSMTLTSPALFQ